MAGFPVMFLGVGDQPAPAGQTIVDSIAVPEYLSGYAGPLDHTAARKALYRAWRALGSL